MYLIGTDGELPQNRFAGHATGTRVNALSVSLDGESLLSGGEDGNALVWDIGSRQLVRTMQHKGPVLNAFFTLAPAVMFDAEQRLPLISKNLRRMLDSAAADDEHVVEVLVRPDGEQLEWWLQDGRTTVEEDDWSSLLAGAVTDGGSEGLIGLQASKHNASGQVNGGKRTPAKKGAAAATTNDDEGTVDDEVERLRAEVRSLKQINKKLYKFQVDSLLKK